MALLDSLADDLHWRTFGGRWELICRRLNARAILGIFFRVASYPGRGSVGNVTIEQAVSGLGERGKVSGSGVHSEIDGCK
jgi:hypothetical protein